MTTDKALEALRAQGITSPGPKLLEAAADAIAREEEQLPAGVRVHELDPAELLADTPELEGRSLEDVLTKAVNYRHRERPDF
jgi:hypothetical protein